MISLPAIRGTIGDANLTFGVDIPTLQLPSGALVYLLGPNGSGKSVYLKSLIGEFRSLNRKKVPIKSNAVFVDPVLIRQSADDNLALGLSVLETMTVWARAGSLREYLFPKTRNQQILQQLSHFSSLGLSPDKVARELSGGQKQGLVLLSRMQRSPQLLLLDEFTSAVDAQSSEKLLEVVRSLASSNGTTALIVTHDLLEAAKHADACIVFAGGRLLERFELSGSDGDRYDRIRTTLIRAWETQVVRLANRE